MRVGVGLGWDDDDNQWGFYRYDVYDSQFKLNGWWW